MFSRKCITLALSLAFVVPLAACNKDDGNGGGSTGGAAKLAEPAAKSGAPAAPLTWKKVASMGIEVEVTSNSEVEDNTASARFPSSTVYPMDGTPTTFIFGAKDPADSVMISKDLDATKERIKKELSGFKAFTKEDKTAKNAFELRYTGTDMMETDKPLYGVTIRSKVAGLVLDCSTKARTEAEIEKTVKLCKSIRAAK